MANSTIQYFFYFIPTNQTKCLGILWKLYEWFQTNKQWQHMCFYGSSFLKICILSSLMLSVSAILYTLYPSLTQHAAKMTSHPLAQTTFWCNLVQVPLPAWLGWTHKNPIVSLFIAISKKYQCRSSEIPSLCRVRCCNSLKRWVFEKILQ